MTDLDEMAHHPWRRLRDGRYAFRSRRQALGSAFAGLIPLLVLLLLESRPDDKTVPSFAWLIAAGVAVVVFLTLVSAGVVVHVDERRLTVRNPVSTETLSFNEIESFEIGPEGSLLPTGVANLEDGSMVRLWAVQPSRRFLPENEQPSRQAVARLNEMLRDFS